jgi:hypothetical protein
VVGRVLVLPMRKRLVKTSVAQHLDGWPSHGETAFSPHLGAYNTRGSKAVPRSRPAREFIRRIYRNAAYAFGKALQHPCALLDKIAPMSAIGHSGHLAAAMARSQVRFGLFDLIHLLKPFSIALLSIEPRASGMAVLIRVH